MGKGFGGLPGNMQALMKQAQKMQEDLKRVQEQAEKATVEASSGGGMVKVVVSGQNQLVSIQIEKEVVNPQDIEMLQDLVVAAVNAGLQKAQEMTKNELAKITGGMNIPGLF